LPSGSLPSGSLPSGSLPSGSLPSGSLPSGSLDAYSSAARRSLMGTSMDPYATVQTIERNTYDLQENLYVRVIGPYNLATPFSLDVTVFDGVCGALQAVPSSLSVIAGTALAPSTKSSLILTHSGRLPGTPAEVTTALADLQRLAVRTDVNGVVIDLADAKYQRVAWANTQADQFPACPTAKNTVAREIKAVIDAYRAANTASGATTLKYIVLAGGASVIPFFQVQDVAGLANEKEYVAPVAPSTPSEAGLRAGLVQGQDAYGSQINLSRGDHTLAIPDLAVGRLVDSASDISIAINAYIATNGVVVPQSALVTGYDFVGDAAAAIKVETDAGTRSQSDTLIQPVGEPPTGPNAWTADQLRTKLLSGNFDIAVLSGHFSAGNLLAADYTTKLTAEEIANSTANLTNVIILALGCHGGYSIPSSDLLTGASPNPDWAKAFLRKGAAGFVAATGYAYGDTELTEYGERLFVGIAQQLRTGSGPISLGQALVAAKRQYLAQTAQLTGIDEKTVIEMALYGLPMMKVDMPGTRLNPSVETPIVNSTSPATTGPGANTGLSSTVTTLAPTVVTNTKPLVNLSNNTTVTTTYLSGADGVVANPYEPIYPKDLYNVSIPNRVLRGVAFRGGVYSDRTGIIPLTSAPATETSSAHLAFTTDVFYPNQTWLPNFYDAFSGGLTRLIVIPAQYQSRAPGTIDGTLRTFNNLNLQLYYLPSDWAAPTSSATVKSAAVSAAPTILGASAEENNGIVTFSVNAQADGSADVQSIWVLYTGKLGSTYHGQWLPLDLTRSASDTTLWTGTLALQSGANAQDLQFMVQAVGGAGLTTLATNLGAYYSVTSAGTVVPTPIATTLALQSPPTAGIYLKDSSFSLILTAANQPLAGKNVTLDIGGQQAQATTDANGRATITLKPVLTPGSYTVQASFRGSADYIGSTASSAFILNKDSTTVTVTPTSATITLGQSTPIVAVVRDSANQALGGKSVFFVLHNTSQTLVRSVISDYLGNAALGAVPLPIGIYTVDVYFNGTIPTGGSQPLILSDDYYASSNRLGSALTIANVSDTTPPTITAAATTAPNANGWYKTSVTVRFTCADAGSGIASGSCPADQTLSAEGSAVSSTARTVADVAGNISAPSNIVTVKIDKTAPTSTGSVTINGNQATVTLSASDSLSGVASTSYRINNGTQQTYSAPFVISTAGTYVVTYFSTDRAGNAEAAKTLTFTVLSILDTFNRANGGVGSNWDGTTGTAAYKIASNRLDVQLGGPIYWKTAFGKSQEAFVTLSTIDTGSREQGVLLKVQTSSVKMAGGIAVVYDAKARAVRVETLRVNSLTWTLYANQAVTFNNGDRLGARALADGTIQIYKNGVLVATVTLNAADKTFFNSKGGNIGLWMVDAANGLVDDFGGGTLAP
ncbi:MAG: hypothetical protein SH847_27070, partial [Roseiflexaceae bacterium]|nr:hypothetical protein [Roseiflexaceae bacterium]